mgnify:CR=1 FL=1
MKQRITASIILLFALVAISFREQNETEPPLATVIKLESAEAVADFSYARSYIDVEKVYANDEMAPEEAWKKMVMFHYNLSKDKRFSNTFPYYKYDITEKIKDKKSEVIFKSKDITGPIKAIIYKLDLVNDKWIVVKIDYIKS